jgi:steroid delta-isomerase-like uncharacterized protein
MKNPILVVSLVLLLCFCFGCQNKETIAELKQMKASAAQVEQNKVALRRLLEETDKGNYAAWDEICAPDYKFHYPSNAKPISLEEHKQANKSLPAAFPDFHHTIEVVFAEGDKTVFRATLTGTHKGNFMGIPATGKSVEYSAIGIARFSDGKIAEMWLEADFMGLFQQLGMELKPKEVDK